jgi:hypothetical protein
MCWRFMASYNIDSYVQIEVCVCLFVCLFVIHLHKVAPVFSQIFA